MSTFDFDREAYKIAHSEFGFAAVLDEGVKAVVDGEDSLVVRRREVLC